MVLVGNWTVGDACAGELHSRDLPNEYLRNPSESMRFADKTNADGMALRANMSETVDPR